MRRDDHSVEAIDYARTFLGPNGIEIHCPASNGGLDGLDQVEIHFEDIGREYSNRIDAGRARQRLGCQR